MCIRDRPNGVWGSIPASGIIPLQVGPIHMVDLNCLMDDLSTIGELEIRLASSQFIGTPMSCLRVIESVYDIRDADGNIAPNLVTVHFTLENDDPITQTPSAGITCGETFTMQSELDYIYTIEPPSNGVSTNQDCRSALIWATPQFKSTMCIGPTCNGIIPDAGILPHTPFGVPGPIPIGQKSAEISIGSAQVEVGGLFGAI